MLVEHTYFHWLDAVVASILSLRIPRGPAGTVAG